MAILATTGPGNRAHAMPVWVYLRGRPDHSRRGRELPEATQHRPERAGDAGDRPPASSPTARLWCRAPPRSAPPRRRETRLKIATRYLGEQRAREYIEQTAGGDSISIRLTPQRFVEYGSLE